jgi:hypothetical protein
MVRDIHRYARLERLLVIVELGGRFGGELPQRNIYHPSPLPVAR